MTDYNQWPSIKQLHESLVNKQTTATELVETALLNIEKTKHLNIVINTCESYARELAKKIDQKIASGQEIGLLEGIPFIIKDNYLTKDIETTAASNILKGFIPPYSATAVQKLIDAGAIPVAKANLDAFAHGSSTENSDFGPTLNPLNPEYVPGGSSGGSAAAIAAGLVPFSLGSDTGGSIRLPAAFCGVTGLKPTYGLVSRYGVVAMASSTDCMGPLANSAEDCAVVMSVIAGQDQFDSTTIDGQNLNFLNNQLDLSELKIGVIEEYMPNELDADIKAAVNQVIDFYQSKGATIERISLPSLKLGLACYYVLVPAEVSSNLSRYDGIRYGLSEPGDSLAAVYKNSRSKGFNRENKRRIMIGTYVLSSGYYDAYYKKAQKLRTKIIEEFDQAFQKVDFLIGPTAPTRAFKIGQNSDDPLQMYLTDIMTVSANLAGIPAISFPSQNVTGLPIGIQLMSNQKTDDQLLSLVALYQNEKVEN